MDGGGLLFFFVLLGLSFFFISLGRDVIFDIEARNVTCEVVNHNFVNTTCKLYNYGVYQCTVGYLNITIGTLYRVVPFTDRMYGSPLIGEESYSRVFRDFELRYPIGMVFPCYTDGETIQPVTNSKLYLYVYLLVSALLAAFLFIMAFYSVVFFLGRRLNIMIPQGVGNNGNADSDVLLDISEVREDL